MVSFIKPSTEFDYEKDKEKEDFCSSKGKTLKIKNRLKVLFFKIAKENKRKANLEQENVKNISDLSTTNKGLK